MCGRRGGSAGNLAGATSTPSALLVEQPIQFPLLIVVQDSQDLLNKHISEKPAAPSSRLPEKQAELNIPYYFLAWLAVFLVLAIIFALIGFLNRTV